MQVELPMMMGAHSTWVVPHMNGSEGVSKAIEGIHLKFGTFPWGGK
jgi:hypothetical protein